ncbi:hypothetical protein J5N97_014055 [Dioscorea zingiberensis]|uniref:Uncharacterized protein n=1 Tax=Dioscorea zingiberensis TaxID=325984 RepID=A0A9D5CRW9_9LILI|nr:hypothetical protein J5N97_014055 [Dioscorea zingiberensis]
MPMASEGLFSISVASVMEEVLKQHGTRLSDTNLASRKAEEAASRRYEAARWLRKTVGVVGAKDLPEEPSEEEFRLGLRNGLILCNALNKIQPGKSEGDSVHLPDGAALSAYQYFENVRNFLVAVQEMGFPLFEASDLEQNTSHSLNTLVRAVLSGKKPDEVPLLVESVLCKLMEELQNHITNRNEMVQTPSKDQADGNRSFLKQKVSAELVSVPGEPRMETEESNLTKPKKESCFQMISKVENDVASKDRLLKQCVIFDQQERDIQELKQALCETRAGMKFMQMKYFEECNYLGKYLHSLAHAATGYHKVLEENRKLYNQVQDLKGGQAKTLMFVHISPEMDAIGETISTLKFAERVSTVELGAARANKESGEVKELKEQILSLKAALARKGGEEHFQGMTPSPDALRMKNDAPSPVYSNQGVNAGHQMNRRQPMEDVGNIEARSKNSSKQKKPSYDFQELLATNDSLPWLDQSPRVNFQKDDERDIGSGEWVDKIMVNREEPGSMTRDGIPIGDWEGDSARLPDLFYQRFLHDSTGEGNQRHTLNAARRKGSYDFDMQRNRTPSHSHIPPPSQKTLSGSGHATNRAGRQPISGSNDSKLGSSGGKMGNVK